MSRPSLQQLSGVALTIFAVAGLPHAPAQGRPLTSDDAALGGVELSKAVTLPADGKFRTVLTIKGVKFSAGEDARALLGGVLSVRNGAATGNALLKARMAVNGIPESEVYLQSVGAGNFASGPIRCNAIVAAGGTYDYALQVAVTGSGPLVVGAGTFDLVAFRPIFNPPP
ncbi:MAG: hypothetical protein U1E52_16790 [Geminicoccaceae bacterium]